MRILLVVATLFGCTDDGRFTDLALHDEPRTLRYAVAIDPIPRVDLLVVVDRSPAMRRYRGHVVENLARTIDALALERPSLHLGVVSADVGDGVASGIGPGACSADGDDGRFARDAALDGDFAIDLELGDGSRARNYDGTLGALFARLASFREGCRYARPFEAMRRALSRYPQFRREGATLFVAFVTASDDASPDAVAEYVDFLRTRGPEHDIYVSMIAPASYCDATPTPRLEAFAAAFTNRTSFEPICSAGTPIIDPLEHVPHSICVSNRLVDARPDEAGLQPACTGELFFDDRPSQLVPPCATGPAPCWALHPDRRACPYDDMDNLLRFERELLDTTPPGTIFQLDCLVDR